MVLDPTRPLYRILAEFDPRDTILVATSLMLGARMAHEKCKIPLVTICLQPQVFWSVDKPSVFPTGNKKLLDSHKIKSQCLHYSKKIDFHQAEQRLCKAIEKVSEQKLG